MTPSLAYDEIVDFIAGMNPGSVVAYSPSEATRDRVRDLIDREKTARLSPDEASELDSYVQLEHIMTLAKAKVRLRLGHEWRREP